MAHLADGLVFLIGLLHVWIFVLESFLWKTPRGLKAFRLTPEKAEITYQLAQNQGVYNLFLAAGLFWALVAAPELALPLKYFFLGSVAVAGLVGGTTVSKNIYFIQTLPAALAITALLLA